MDIPGWSVVERLFEKALHRAGSFSVGLGLAGAGIGALTLGWTGSAALALTTFGAAFAAERYYVWQREAIETRIKMQPPVSIQAYRAHRQAPGVEPDPFYTETKDAFSHCGMFFFSYGEEGERLPFDIAGPFCPYPSCQGNVAASAMVEFGWSGRLLPGFRLRVQYQCVDECGFKVVLDKTKAELISEAYELAGVPCASLKELVKAKAPQDKDGAKT